MNLRYRVTLTTEERQQLELLARGGSGAVRILKRAQILLAADAGSTDEAIAQNVGVGTSTVYRTKQWFVEQGLERASTSPRVLVYHATRRRVWIVAGAGVQRAPPTRSIAAARVGRTGDLPAIGDGQRVTAVPVDHGALPTPLSAAN